MLSSLIRAATDPRIERLPLILQLLFLICLSKRANVSQRLRLRAGLRCKDIYYLYPLAYLDA